MSWSRTITPPGVQVTQEDVDDMLVTAFEGGINYWCDHVEVVTPADRFSAHFSTLVARGGVARLIVPEDDEDAPDRILTRDKMAEAIADWIRKNGYARWENIPDAADCDEMVQMAVFGEVIFG